MVTVGGEVVMAPASSLAVPERRRVPAGCVTYFAPVPACSPP
jgi:hypothetical protein